MTNKEKLLIALAEVLPNDKLCELAEDFISCSNCPAKKYCYEHNGVYCCSKLFEEWLGEDENEDENDNRGM